jgi:branched-chain amino acid transport system ATP-binding protein
MFYGAIEALRGISLKLSAGEIADAHRGQRRRQVTTLRAIMGLVAPRRARSGLGNRPVPGRRSSSCEGRSSCRRAGDLANLTVRENLEMGAYARRDRPAAKDFEKVYEIFPRLKEREKQTGGTLSGGEQQMLAIGRALMSRPQVLLLDEPSLGLAPMLVHTIFEAIEEIHRQGTPVLLVEQNAMAALKHSNRAYVLETGTVSLEGTSDEVAANPKVKGAYLGE